VIVFSVSCTRIEYDGAEFAPTTEVLILQDTQVRKLDANDYEIMGKLKLHGRGLIGGANLREKILKHARKLGADAVVYDFYSERWVNKQRDWLTRHPNELEKPVVKEKFASAFLIKFKETLDLSVLLVKDTVETKPPAPKTEGTGWRGH
jgi:hypothetical protein